MDGLRDNLKVEVVSPSPFLKKLLGLRSAGKIFIFEIGLTFIGNLNGFVNLRIEILLLSCFFSMVSKKSF